MKTLPLRHALSLATLVLALLGAAGAFVHEMHAPNDLPARQA